MANKQFHVRHGLQVSGSGLITGNLQVTQGVSSSQRIRGAILESDGTLQVSGNASVGGSLNVTGSTTVHDNLAVCGQGNIGGSDFSGGHLRIGDSNAGIAMDPNEIYFAGIGTIGTLSGDLTLNPNSGGVIAKGTLQVSGVTSVGGQFKVAGNACLQGSANVNGIFQVSGNACIGGLLNLKNNLSVNGSTILSGAVQAKSDVSVGGKLIVGGSTICDSVILASNVSTQFLQVSGNASVGGTLTVTTVDATDIQASGILSGAQIRGTSLAVTTVDAGTVQASGTISGNALHSATTLQVSGTASVGALRAAGLTCLQAGAVVTQNLQIRNELDFIGATQKYMDFALLSSNGTQYSANFRSFDSNTQNFHTHIKFTRAGAVELYNNNNKKLETNGNGIFVSGTVSASANVYAGQQLRAGGAVSVAGDVRGQGLLQISGTASIGGQIQGGGNVYATQQLRAGGSVSVAGNVIGKGNLHISGSASVGGTLQCDGGISCSGSARVDQQLDVNGQIHCAGYLSVATSINIENTGNPFLEIHSNASGVPYIDLARNVNGTAQNFGVRMILRGDDQFDISGAAVRIGQNMVVAGTLSGTGTIRAAAQIAATGSVSSAGDVRALGQLRATGGVSVQGASYLSTTTFNGKISANQISASNQVIVDQQVQCDGSGLFGQTVRAGSNLCGQGNAYINGILRVTASTDLNSTLQVNGTVSATSLYSSGQVRAAVTLSGGQIHTNGNTQIAGYLSAAAFRCAGNISGGGQLHCTGRIEFLNVWQNAGGTCVVRVGPSGRLRKNSSTRRAKRNISSMQDYYADLFIDNARPVAFNLYVPDPNFPQQYIDYCDLNGLKKTIDGCRTFIEDNSHMQIEWDDYSDLKYNEGEDPNRKYYGLIAEELGEHIPELCGYDQEEQHFNSVKYETLGVFLTNVVKRNKDRIALMQSEIDALTARVATLESA